MLTPAGARKLGIGEETLGRERARTALTGDRPCAVVSVSAVTLDASVFYIADLAGSRRRRAEFDVWSATNCFAASACRRLHAGRADDRRTVAPTAPVGARSRSSRRHHRIVADARRLPIHRMIPVALSLTLHSPFVKKNAPLARYGANVESVTGWGARRAARYPALERCSSATCATASPPTFCRRRTFANPTSAATSAAAFCAASRSPTTPTGACTGRMRISASSITDRSGLWLLATATHWRSPTAAGSAGAGGISTATASWRSTAKRRRNTLSHWLRAPSGRPTTAV